MNAQIFISGLLLASILSSCDKPKANPYPGLSSEGKNIWACKINGDPVVYKGERGLTGAGVKASVYGSGTTITSMVLSGSGNGFKGHYDLQNIQFNQANPELNKKYYFNSDTAVFEYTNQGLGLGSIPYGYWSSYTASGWVKFSRIDGAVSGEFELKVINIGDTTYPVSPVYDTLYLTEGRFDLKR